MLSSWSLQQFTCGYREAVLRHKDECWREYSFIVDGVLSQHRWPKELVDLVMEYSYTAARLLAWILDQGVTVHAWIDSLTPPPEMHQEIRETCIRLPISFLSQKRFDKYRTTARPRKEYLHRSLGKDYNHWYL